MSKNISLPDPERFNLSSFSDILPKRDPIIGEDLWAFDAFRDAMISALAPATPYEFVIAENLIAIEWELLQHRRMRDAGVRRIIREEICEAVANKRKAEHEREEAEAKREHYASGGSWSDWEGSIFERDAAEKEGADLAKRAVAHDQHVREKACEEIEELGLHPLELMAQAYHERAPAISFHENKMRELEKLRHTIRREYEALVRCRPFEGEVVER
ncbi:hypothetical protein [Marimonas lutisalis]|uniref:hypothetical protein n=1 Tax=Marimonas lutisalis TaxID=2545756 RepID=UPI0010F9B114|nr:hypothetical protein [Marimonas lutisalis]